MSRPERRRPATVVGFVLVALGGSGLLGSLILLLVGTLFSGIMPAVFGTPWDDLHLDRGGVTGPGELEQVAPNPRLRVNDRATVRVEYRYVADGVERRGEVLVTDDHELARAGAGYPVVVERLPDRPEVSRIRGTRAQLAGFVGLLGLGFAGLGVLFLLLNVALIVAGLVLLSRRRAGRDVG